MQLLHIDDTASLVAAPPFGILEPTTTYADGRPREDALCGSQTLDVLLMPGLGFDLRGNRLGRGGGYYDKALQRLQQLAQEQGKRPPLLVALAFSAQLVEHVPLSAHDEQVDLLVTAEQVHACTERGRQAMNTVLK
mmetsp:Transcript_6188/g.10653  ORF Transcript_6188/g.10653 Transcript_6188/m.10653 type:complete len:136 (+) Transcript_6188:387-794(+)